MLNKRNLLVLFLVVTVLAGLGVLTYYISTHNDALDSDAAEIFGTEEAIVYQSLSGEEVSLEAFEGSVRVVNSWASWSPYSRTELPDLERLAAAYADRGVKVIAINRMEDPIRAKKFLDSLGPLPTVTVLLDGADAFYDRMDGQAMPETLFFDDKGNIVMHARGNLTFEQMEGYVNAALNSTD